MRVSMKSEQKSEKKRIKKRSEFKIQDFELLDLGKEDEFLFEYKTESIAIIQDRLLKYVNRHLAEMTGYTTEELIDSPFGIYIHPDELPNMVNIYLRRMSSREVQSRCESIIRNKTGNKIFVEISAIKITYQGKPADLVLIRYLTKSEQSLDTA